MVLKFSWSFFPDELCSGPSVTLGLDSMLVRTLCPETWSIIIYINPIQNLNKRKSLKITYTLLSLLATQLQINFYDRRWFLKNEKRAFACAKDMTELVPTDILASCAAMNFNFSELSFKVSDRLGIFSIIVGRQNRLNISNGSSRNVFTVAY